ncbi:glycoside hydrolase family 13 protein [Tulasnella calospora MUT 4182]|uniref:Alpha-amylase n=1 Tax=Tulasnella calospora MUT 4182 TaxID=1051891 RepID=A0A0C3M9C4_9AGAM|nr:glycoside hydrolase family 13 protein [Tulasnella calospora MUT 4182]
MFQWNWDSIAAECTQFIGPAGYGYVQVSPPQEHITGSQWWTDYQPTSYQLVSKRGNRDKFANMISTCHAAGVGVIVDTIWNHMAGISSGTGTAGTAFSTFRSEDLCLLTDLEDSDGDIHDYTNRTEVQFCELVNLADLDTASPAVRAKLAAYGNDLISLGVDGFRLDAAKHIPSGDIAAILSALSKNVYVTQEVSWGSGEPIQPSEYTTAGDVQEFRYLSALKDAFTSSNLASLANIASNPTSQGWVPSGEANIFVANHDTERSGNSIAYKWDRNTYTLATIFSLAYPYGTPTILSGYYFTNNDDGAPNDGAGSCNDGSGWICQHRWSAVTGMVKFFNQVKGTSLNAWVSDQASQIAFGRGSSGFVAINYSSSIWTKTFTTSLPDGSYCDVVHGSLIVVSGGKITMAVPTYDALAVYVGAALLTSAKRGVGLGTRQLGRSMSDI